MTARTVLLALLREVFPAWDIWICDRGVWRATGLAVISASLADGLLERLANADADAVQYAAARLSAGPP
ncbi:hypothetical protein ACFVH6_15325 [Spirillospora sp. NPDC127200]